MHILTNYALQLGQYIDKFFIYEKFIPVPTDKPYLCIHTTSKPSKSYSKWQDVIDILKPILDKNNIDILQIGGKDDLRVNGSYDFCGQTSYAQTAYIIKNCLFFLGADSFPGHLSGHYSKPSTILFSNNYINCICPYFGDKTKQIFLEPDRSKFLYPSFSFEENPKSIDTIKPELIASSVCKLLNLTYDYPYQSLYFGEFYHQKLVECVPNQVINPAQLGISTIIIRYDLFQNEQCLAGQIQQGKTVIVTDRTLNIELLKTFKNNINQIVYIVSKNTNPSEILQYQQLGIKTDMISYLSEEELNEIKLDFCEIGMIFSRPPKKLFDYDELKGKDINKLFYKSNKFILSSGKIYLSEYDYKNNNPVPDFNTKIRKIDTDLEEFTKEISHFCILEKI